MKIYDKMDALDPRVTAFLERNTKIQDFAIGSYVRERQPDPPPPPVCYRSAPAASFRSLASDDSQEAPGGASFRSLCPPEPIYANVFRVNEWTDEWDAEAEAVLKDLKLQNLRAMMYLYDPTEENLLKTFEPLKVITEEHSVPLDKLGKPPYLVAPLGYHNNLHIFYPRAEAEVYSPTDMHFVVEKVLELKWTPMIINKQMLDLYRLEKWETMDGTHEPNCIPRWLT